jgi:hypothetical protein
MFGPRDKTTPSSFWQYESIRMMVLVEEKEKSEYFPADISPML